EGRQHEASRRIRIEACRSAIRAGIRPVGPQQLPDRCEPGHAGAGARARQAAAENLLGGAGAGPGLGRRHGSGRGHPRRRQGDPLAPAAGALEPGRRRGL
ncbi:MAG: hypothetical protein AVDCRST_MAG51-445, partial [uncultured Ramlibacter sp.]